MNRRTTALLLVAALALTACGASVLAAAPQLLPSKSDQDTQLPAGGLTSAAIPFSSAPAAESSVQASDPGPEAVSTSSLSFGDLEKQIREQNLNLLALDANIDAIKAIDYDVLTDEIKDSLDAIAKQQKALSSLTLPPTDDPVQDAVNQTLADLATSSALQTLQSTYDSLDATFDDLRSGNLEDDNDAVVRQLRNAKNQIVKGGQALYIALVQMDVSSAALDRSLAALDRTIQEMELRYDMGQISALTLQEVKAGRTSLVSGQQTLAMNLTNYKTQLELMVGADLTGTLQLQPLTRVTDQELAAMDLEADLEKAKQNSYDLFSSRRAMDEADDAFGDACIDYNSDDYQYITARHSLRAAQYTYEAAVQNFEVSFRALYLQVFDYKQVLDAAETALALEQASYSASQLKYTQGSLSQNALLTAEDELKTAQDTVDTAAIDLFSAYNNYRWAVDYGILN